MKEAKEKLQATTAHFISIRMKEFKNYSKVMTLIKSMNEDHTNVRHNHIDSVL